MVLVFFGLLFGSNLFAQSMDERTVVITITQSAENGYTVDPSDLYIPARASHVPIRFTLNSDDYEFMTSEGHGFSIDDDTGEFMVRGLGGKNKSLLVMDKNRIARDYYYTITVVNPDTGATLLIDPRIINGGGGID